MRATNAGGVPADEVPGREDLVTLYDAALDANADAGDASPEMMRGAGSTMRRTATLCTRPALNPVCTFFQRTGLTS